MTFDRESGVYEAVRKDLRKFVPLPPPNVDSFVASVGSSAAGGGIGPTVFVAASDSSEESQAASQLQATGTDDGPVIQQANDAMPSTGGQILLSEGSFDVLAGTADGFTLSAGVSIVGTGPFSTFLTGSTGNASYGVVNASSTSQVANVAITAVSSGAAIIAAGGDGTLISNVYLTADGNHITHNGAGRLTVINSFMDGAGPGYVTTSGPGWLIGNIIEVGEHGVSLTDSSGGMYSLNYVAAGTGTDNTYDNIILAGNSDRNVIETNYLFPTVATSPRYGVNVSAATCNTNRIGDNQYGVITDYGTDFLNDAGTGTFYPTATNLDLSDGRATLTVGAGNMGKKLKQDCRVVGVVAEVGTAPTGADVILDVQKNGGANNLYTTQGNRPTITATTTTSTTTLPDVVNLLSTDYVTADIDQIGSTIAGGYLVVTLLVIYI